MNPLKVIDKTNEAIIRMMAKLDFWFDVVVALLTFITAALLVGWWLLGGGA